MNQREHFKASETSKSYSITLYYQKNRNRNKIKVNQRNISFKPFQSRSNRHDRFTTKVVTVQFAQRRVSHAAIQVRMQLLNHKLTIWDITISQYEAKSVKGQGRGEEESH